MPGARPSMTKPCNAIAADNGGAVEPDKLPGIKPRLNVAILAFLSSVESGEFRKSAIFSR